MQHKLLNCKQTVPLAFGVLQNILAMYGMCAGERAGGGGKVLVALQVSLVREHLTFD